VVQIVHHGVEVDLSDCLAKRLARGCEHSRQALAPVLDIVEVPHQCPRWRQRAQLERLLEGDPGFAMVPELTISFPKVIPGLGILRLTIDHLAPCREGFAMLAEMAIRLAQCLPRHYVLRFASQQQF
jgi:hypothetical protein